jgi:inorganic triphosphatase YgiF
MPEEIEVKLHVPPRHAAVLARRPWLGKLATQPPKREKLVSVYYDTQACALRKADISLRVRRIGDNIVQTVKRSAAGTYGRQEWEWPIAGVKPDLARARRSALADEFSLKKLRRKLKPVFETDVLRSALPVRYRGSEVEIAFDSGQVRSGRRREAISEIELELKGGDPEGLLQLARRIAREAKARYGALPKAARGYALMAGEVHAPVRARPIHLNPAMTAGDYFKAVAFSCLDHFAANENAVAAGEPEGVHQMRVGLRRLRTAIAFFKTLLRGAETEAVKKELKWLTEELGPARDMDVLVTEGVKKLEEEEPEQETVPVLEQELKARRRGGFARAKAALATDRYRELVLDTALWIAGGRWARDGDALAAARRSRGGRGFAAEEMSRRYAKILKQQKKLEKLDALKRHKLRIKIKKLRYACDFFESLFEAGGRRRKFTRALKSLQSSLGKLNDIRVHGGLARDFAHPRRHDRRRAEKAFAMGLLSGREEAAKDDLIAKAVKSGRKLRRLSPFWS